LDGVCPNLLGQNTQSLTAVFSHRRYAGIRNSEASLPLLTLVSGPLPPVPDLSDFSSPFDRSDPATGRKSGITRRSLPLFGLPRPTTVRPHRRSDGLGPNLLGQTTQILTPAFSHKRYTCIRNSEVSLPLHSKLTLNPAVSSNPGSSSLSHIRTSYSYIPIDL
jgi:hypothetical protein